MHDLKLRSADPSLGWLEMKAGSNAPSLGTIRSSVGIPTEKLTVASLTV